MGLVGWMDARFYPGISSGWDDKVFHEYILRRLRPEMTVLDLGAGAGIIPLMNFRGCAAKISGIDPDPRVMKNPFLDDAMIGMGEALPYGDGSFDLIFSHNTLEHLVEPERVFAEVRRVLKPGGRFLFKTPNRRHYVPTIARLTPHRLHQLFAPVLGREERDTFPTVYAANTPQCIRKIAMAVGLDVSEIILFESRPEYLRMSAPTYLFGIAWERAVNAVPALAGFRVGMIGELVK